ncbi:MAG: DUF3141 domain-containing protein [Corticimicrobacter sp.]|uniref:DUF3141 domain-containing protein n=1 Tax=Corticimicrobacter sp. TaxID=2678536 RepID=UPI0032DB6862
MRDHQTFNPLGEFFRHLTPPAGTAGLPGPWAAYEYALDAWQRSVLLLDVLRQRANRPDHHKAKTAAAQDSDAEAVVGQEAVRLLAALQRLSEVDAEHYEQHVRPLLEQALTPAFAHLLVERQLPRLDDAVFSDRNPLMQGVAQLAATVRAERHPADSDNPYLLLQQQLSGLLADALHTYADLRDQAVEQVFLTLRALPRLPDFVQGTQPAEAKLKASVPAAKADAPAKAIAKPAVAAKVPAAKKTAPGKPAAGKPAKPVAAKPAGATPVVSAPNRPAAARAAKPSRPQPASQQASLPGVAERPAGTIPAAVSSATAQPAVAAVAAVAPSPVVAPTVLAPAAVASPVTAKATDAAPPPAAPRPAPSAQARPDAKLVTPVASTPKPAVKKAVAAPGSKTAAATPAAAMAATIAALAAPVEKTVPARASASTRSKKPAAKPAAAKSGTAAKPVPPATPRKR